MEKIQIAKLNYLRIAPRKVRLVADLIKGSSVNDAEAQLLFIRKRANRALLKLLESAVANAKNNQKLDVSKLFIKDIRVTQGPMLKRYLPRARGVATPIQKKMSHVLLILAENPALKEPKYKIVIPKKVKAHKEALKKEKKEKEKIEEKEEKKEIITKKPGFMRRFFNPKSRASK